MTIHRHTDQIYSPSSPFSRSMRAGKKIFGFLLLTFIIFSVIAPAVTFAQLKDYTVLAPLPGTTKCGQSGGPDCKTDFQTYLPGLFNFSIGIAAVLAFAVISYGGFLYMTTDSVFNKEEGKKHIKDAVYGLLLVIGAYAILYTINPQILNFNLNIIKPVFKSTSTVTAGGAGSVPTGPVSNMSETDLRAYLDNKNIGVPNDPCTGTQTSGCTNVAGLLQNTVDQLAGLAQQCGCRVTITGGTEGGHSSHSDGTTVDIASNGSLDNIVVGNQQLQACKTYPQTVNGRSANFLWEPKGSTCGGAYPSSGPHWHVVFN